MVHNDSPIVDQLTLSLDGLEADWFGLSATSFNLFPGEHAELQLEVRAPTGALAAVRPFSAAAARSGVRTRFAARIPAHRTLCPVTSPPTRAVRATRPVGSFFASGGGSSACLLMYRG